jgi:O-antigen ligase
VDRALGIGPPAYARLGELVAWPAFVLGASALTAALTLWSVQAALAAVCVLGVLAIHLRNRSAGIAAVLAFWWIAPLLRRIVQQQTGYVSSDPLSLAPFVATGVVVAVELQRARLSSTAARVLACAAAAFALGLPAGLQAGPFAATYALMGYLTALGFAVVGYAEARSGRLAGLAAALRYALPAVAVYAIVQAVAMPPWDQAWLDTVQITSIGVGDGSSSIRAFGTLNAPGTLAGVLGVALAWYLAVRRPGAWGAACGALFLVVLALTYVRGAWVGLLAAALAHAVVSRGRSVPRIAVAVAATVLVVGVAAGASPAAGSLVTRISTFGDLGQDTSAQARLATPATLIGSAATAPLGHGLGTTGEASRLTGSRSALRYPDNAYLALIVQSGPIALLLMLGAVAAIMRVAWRLARRPSEVQAAAQAGVAVLVFALVFMVSGDHFYGAVGVAFWLVAGAVLGLERHTLQPEGRSP